MDDKNICLASNTRRHSCKKNEKNKLWCKGFVAYVFVTAKNLGKGIKKSFMLSAFTVCFEDIWSKQSHCDRCFMYM